MRKLICIAVIGTVTLISGCTNTYDKEIDQVIRLENVLMKDAKKDIDKIERNKTCIRVYQDGNLIELTYDIRTNRSITEYYKKINNEYKWVNDTEAKKTANLETEKPVYQENNCE
ncbi:cystatin-like fold lipoprotein [Bacillus cereus]|uniref:cystatin-like fold lipoprotein n=1 Tax=Bacillus cereus TaxID=1396 RepID=UPI003012E35D